MQPDDKLLIYGRIKTVLFPHLDSGNKAVKSSFVKIKNKIMNKNNKTKRSLLVPMIKSSFPL